MCNKPIHHLGQAFACRTCNECIAARQNDWVMRAMAEKASARQTFVITLTYADVNGKAPRNAKHFEYRDLQLFFKRLRDQYYQKYHARGEIRYLVCGELGAKKGRAHWHLILFSQENLHELGQWTDMKGETLPGMMLNKNMNWTLWPYGLVYVQIPNEGGINYALKYALKDQFNVVKSKGTMREAKAEVHSASFFRMSKKPPIGWIWLENKIKEWEEKRIVPVSLDIRVPGSKWTWYPKGEFRHLLLEGLHRINSRMVMETGKPAPQWAALIGSILAQKESETREKDLEVLEYGYEESTKAKAEQSHVIYDDRREFTAAGQIRRNCGRIHPCFECESKFSAAQRRQVRVWQYQLRETYRRAPSPEHLGPLSVAERFERECRPNPFCSKIQKDPGFLDWAFDPS